MSAKSGAKEGRNLKFAIVDEVHEMKDDKNSYACSNIFLLHKKNQFTLK